MIALYQWDPSESSLRNSHLGNKCPALHTETTATKQHVALSFVAIQTQKYSEKLCIFEVFFECVRDTRWKLITTHNSFPVPIHIAR